VDAAGGAVCFLLPALGGLSVGDSGRAVVEGVRRILRFCNDLASALSGSTNPHFPPCFAIFFDRSATTVCKKLLCLAKNGYIFRSDVTGQLVLKYKTIHFALNNSLFCSSISEYLRVQFVTKNDF
jgi:hypothetical protein